MKRVRCLYRVSTERQLDKNDIPMQRIVCTEFIERMPDWIFDKEYIEKGVSGYNKKLEDRDVLQEIKEDALNKEFDVLLVFMFDRLGRRDDETPFIVEWFVRQGIEVWSTQEGQQRFDTRVDKLINYLRYWQSGGESEKTSIRVRTKQKQMIEAGINIYSKPLYGFELVKSGVFSKKGVERKIYKRIPSEVKIIQKIFDLSSEEGLGGVKVANYLNERNYKTKEGNYWSASSVNRILANPTYTGHLVYGKTGVPIGGGRRRKQEKSKWIYSNEVIPELAIISVEQFEKVRAIKKSRKEKNEQLTEENKKCIYQTGSLLFSGYIICGSCGRKMIIRQNKREKKFEDGTTGYIYYKYYACSLRTDGRKECNHNKKSHKSNCIEEPVLNEIYAYLDRLEKKDLSEEIKRINEKANNNDGNIIKEIEKKIIECSKKNELFKDEILKILQGQSAFSREMITDLIEENISEKQKLITKKIEVEKEKKKKEIELEQLLQVKTLIPNWKKELEKASQEKKRMMLSSIIDLIIVNDDNIEIKLKMNLEDFIANARPTEKKRGRYLF